MGYEKFYVYVFLNQKYTGEWVYKEHTFYNKPFYVGIGTDYRMTAHFTPFNLNKKSIKNNIIKSIFKQYDELPIFYKIYEGLDVESAKLIEQSIIKHFGKIKDKSGILANLTDGGDGISGYTHSEKYKTSLKKKVYQYDLNGSFIKEWASLKNVITFFNLSGGSGLRASIRTGIHCKEFLWSYEKKSMLSKHLSKHRPRYKYEIYLKNELIKTFDRPELIELFFGKKVSFGNISTCCSGKLKTYLGYNWKKVKIN